MIAQNPSGAIIDCLRGLLTKQFTRQADLLLVAGVAQAQKCLAISQRFVPEFLIGPAQSRLCDKRDRGTDANGAERAIDLLEVYLRQVGPDLKLWFKNDSDLASIASHPGYARLLELTR